MMKHGCGKGELEYSQKNLPCAVLPTTDLTWTHVGQNLGLHYEIMVYDHLRYGKTYNDADSDVGAWSSYNKHEACYVLECDAMLCAEDSQQSLALLSP